MDTMAAHGCASLTHRRVLPLGAGQLGRAFVLLLDLNIVQKRFRSTATARVAKLSTPTASKRISKSTNSHQETQAAATARKPKTPRTMAYLPGYHGTGYNPDAGHIDPRLLRLDFFASLPPSGNFVSPSPVNASGSVFSPNTLVPQVPVETPNVGLGSVEPVDDKKAPLDTARCSYTLAKAQFHDQPDHWDAMGSPGLSGRRGSTASASLGPASSISSMSPASYHHSPDATPLFSCQLCSRADIRSMGELNKHMKFHRKPICCPSCDARFASRKDLGRHRESNHKSKDERMMYRCPHQGCSAKFTREDNRKRHTDKKHGGPWDRSPPRLAEGLGRGHPAG